MAYYLGIDGGGTKTTCAVGDDAQLVATAIAGPSNIVRVGERQARESLAVAEEIGDRAGRVFGVGLFARMAAARGRTERALTLWAAVASENAVAPLGGWRRHRARFEANIRESVGPDFDLAQDQAPALTLDQAVASILAGQHSQTSSPTNTTDPPLS